MELLWLVAILSFPVDIVKKDYWLAIAFAPPGRLDVVYHRANVMIQQTVGLRVAVPRLSSRQGRGLERWFGGDMPLGQAAESPRRSLSRSVRRRSLLA
jgi:hypothetical protein